MALRDSEVDDFIWRQLTVIYRAVTVISLVSGFDESRATRVTTRIRLITYARSTPEA